MAKDYFIVEYEGHITSPEIFEEVAYFPGVRRFANTQFFRGITGETMAQFKAREAAECQGAPKEAVERAIWEMDRSGVDVAFVIPERFGFISDNAKPLQSNGWLIKTCARYPDRLFPAPNFHPTRRGIDEAIWEMEYFAKNQNCKFFKLYPPDETRRMDDEWMFPFYAKAQELGLTMGIHTGLGYVYGGSTENCHPGQLEKICRKFYDLNIVAFHFGWPWHHELNALANTYPNLYVGMSYQNRAIKFRPRWFSELLGEALLWAGPDKVIWSQDGITDLKDSIDAFRSFQFADDLRAGYGYPLLTEEDKAKIFGLNFARLVGMEPRKRTE